MAAESRRQLPVLLGLLVVLAAVLWWQLGGTDAAPPPGGAPATAAVTPLQQGTGAPGAAAPTTAELFARGVGLSRLQEDRPAPQEGGRDPFRSGAGATAAPGASGGTAAAVPVTPVVPVPAAPVVPPGPPPIAVKFIGVVSRQDVGKVAVLSDGKNVYYGREGEIVDGRWRIVSIGQESLQIEYADGRGRQTVRLTG